MYKYIFVRRKFISTDVIYVVLIIPEDTAAREPGLGHGDGSGPKAKSVCGPD